MRQFILYINIFHLILFLSVTFPSVTLAQLSQLEFEDEKLEIVSPTPKPADVQTLKELTTDALPKTAAEAEAMEKAALEKLKNAQQASSATQSSSSSVSSAEPVKKFDYFGGVVQIGAQHGCASIPPRLKGPFVDEGSDSAITSKVTWPLPKNKDCSSVVDDKSYIAKALAIREVLFRFSGNTDYTDLAASQICAKHCDSEPLVSDIKLEGANFSVAVTGDSCRYILDKPKEKAWKMLKAQSLVCSCFEASKAKAAVESQVLETK